MKRTIYTFLTVLIVTAGTWSCQKDELMLFSDANRINFADSTTQSYTFIYDDASITGYDFYIRIQTIGDVVNYDRKVKIVQVPEYDVTYEYDDQGNVTDTIKTVIPNMAVAGKHYVSFDDTAAQAEWIVKANSNTASIPIKLLRDASLDSETVRLRVSIAESDDFQMGEVHKREFTLKFSDRLEKPVFWNINITNQTFGVWSAIKHQFMIDATGERFDDEWWNTNVNGVTGAQSHYQNFLKNKLVEFNNDPDNIASGAAPLTDENGLVAFK